MGGSELEILGHDSVDTVWIEATPVLPVSEDYYGGLGIPEFLREFQSLRVSRDIPLHELNVAIIQHALRENTAVARGGGNYSDQ